MVNSFNEIYNRRVKITLSDRYKNVFNYLNLDHKAVMLPLKAFEKLGIKPKIKPMRGGYDGAVISQKGIPTPNLFTGGHNFHSIYEYIPVNSLKMASEVIKEIIKLAAKEA